MIVRLQSFLPLIPKLQSSIVNRSLGPLAMVTYTKGNLVLSAELIMKIGHNRELLKLTFRALAFRVSNERRRTIKTTNKHTNKGSQEETNKQTNRRTDEQTNRRTDEQTSTRTNEQTHRRIDEQTNKRAHEQTNKRTNEHTNKRTDAQTNRRTNEQTDKRCHLAKDCTSKASSSRDQLFA